MNLLALDASTTITGWCAAVDGEYADSGTKRFSDKLPGWYRVFEYVRWLEAGLASWGPVHAIIYELATGNSGGNMATHRMLGSLEGFTRYKAFLHSIRFVTVTATQVKASGAHKGPAGLIGASGIAGRKITRPDEADAIGVMSAGWAKIVKGRLLKD